MTAVRITGASRGLGEALLSSLLMRGRRVFDLARSPQAADEVRRHGIDDARGGEQSRLCSV